MLKEINLKPEHNHLPIILIDWSTEKHIFISNMLWGF